MSGDLGPGALDPARCALILQDLQNDAIHERGAAGESGAGQHAAEQNVVANAIRLAAACRARGVPVIHVWFVCEPDYAGFRDNAPLFRNIVSGRSVRRGTWGVAPVDGLEPAEGDHVVEKMTMSAWESGELERLLRDNGRDTIINTGAWTNMSVEHTARTGADKGFTVIVPENACSTMTAEWHRASIDFAMQQVATVTDVDTVIAVLG